MSLVTCFKTICLRACLLGPLLLVCNGVSAAEKVVLTAQEQAFLDQHPSIFLGTDITWEPFVIMDQKGEVSGYDSDILQEVNQMTGANFSLVVGSWHEMQKQARQHLIDGLSTGARVDSRREYLSFSDSYVTLQKSVFVLMGNPRQITGPDSLVGATIAIQKGNLADIEQARQFAGVHILEVDSTKALFNTLAEGRADAILGNGATFYLANKMGMPYLQIAFHLDQKLELVFAVRNDWPMALSILNKGLAAIPDHQQVKIQARWFSTQQSAVAQPSQLSELEKQVIERQPVRYCIPPDWLPLDGISDSGEHQGVFGEWLALIQTRLDTEFDRVSYDADNTGKNARQQACDLVSSATPQKANANYLNLTQPVFKSPVVLATRLDQFFLPNLDKVLDKTFAVVEGSVVMELVKARYPDINTIEVATVAKGLELVSEKRAFGLIGPLEVIAYQVKRGNYLNLKISSTLPETVSLSIGVRKDWPEWIPILNKVIADVPEKKRREITNRWIALHYEAPFDYRWLIAAMVAVACVFFLLAYRNRIISRYNTQLRDLNEQLAQKAVTDQLTGLPNRHLLDQEMTRAVGVASRTDTPFSMILLDIDYFKQINDNWGHHQGDEVLQETSQLMRGLCREVDMLGRWGGEEFLLICPGTQLTGAVTLAEKVRRAVQDHYSSSPVPITLSAGVAEYSPKEGMPRLLKRLDEALYRAKHQGRNRVVSADLPIGLDDSA